MSTDFIFVGAGPSGLTGAICAARQGRRCLVIEKKPSLALHPRGETLRFRPILDEILGDGVLDSLSLSRTTLIEYFAPVPDKASRISFNMHSANIAFHWNGFMQAFQKQVDSLNIDLMMNTEVIDTVKDGDRVAGVVFRDADGKETSITADVVFASDGHNSIIGRKAGVDYQSMTNPIIKGLYHQATFDTPGYKFFIIPAGSLDFAPAFPPAIAFLFPRDNRNCEAGVCVMAGSARKLGYAIPSPEALLRVWELLAEQYPVFSDILKDATPEVVEPTLIPATAPLKDFIPQAGVVLLGDTASFIEISGFCGLVSSMECAKYWVNMIIEAQKRSEKPEDIWHEQTMRKMNEAFRMAPVYRYIKTNADRYMAMFETLFVEMRTSEEIIKNWEIVREALDVY
ncbi:FAD-binding protein [bacterium]|nr:FAD-binding protein [bacterium]